MYQERPDSTSRRTALLSTRVVKTIGAIAFLAKLYAELRPSQAAAEDQGLDWGLTNEELAFVSNDGNIWTDPYWAPTFPDYAALRGLPTLFQDETGPVYMHDMVLRDPEFAGVEGSARHRAYDKAMESIDLRPDSRTWNGGCRELAVVGLLCKEPLGEEETVAGFRITRSIRAGLLIALFKGYPALALVEGMPEVTRQRVNHFQTYGKRFVVSYHSSDGGLWFGALKHVEEDGEHVVVTYPIEGERRLNVDRIWGTQYVRNLRTVGQYTEDLAQWQKHVKISELDPRMVFRLAYGIPYKTGS